nr:hypothetical protein [Sphingomonas naasensis]
MILVEQGEHTDRQLGGGVVPEPLRDRHDRHLRLLEDVAIMHELQRVAEQARQ